jgi:hypothetical protein
MIGTVLAKVLECPMLLVQAVFATFVLLIFGIIFYRLTFHPLAKYPGPFLAKFTDLYLAYHAWKGDRHLLFWQCHEKYGKLQHIHKAKLTYQARLFVSVQTFSHSTRARLSKPSTVSKPMSASPTFTRHSRRTKTRTVSIVPLTAPNMHENVVSYLMPLLIRQSKAWKSTFLPMSTLHAT